MLTSGDTQLNSTPRASYRLRLQFGNTPPQEYVIQRTLIVGRSSREHRVDIDLAEAGGYRLGVSRYHLRFDAYQHRITASDMNSSNGSALNGDPMQVHRAYDIQAGDVLCLGELCVHVLAIQPLDSSSHAKIGHCEDSLSSLR